MKRLLIPLFLLAACAQTDNQTYFQIKQAYAGTQKLAIAYKDECTPKPESDQCHATVAKLRAADAEVVDAIKGADPRLIGADDSHDAAKLAALQLAFAKFNNLVISEAK